MLILKSIITLILLLLIIFIFYYIKTSLIYHPISYKDSKLKYQQFYKNLKDLVERDDFIVHKLVQNDNDIFIDTIYLNNPKSDKCVIYFHGESGNMTNCFYVIKFFYNFSSIIIFDYRSYGKSTGFKINLTYQDLNKDAMVIWKYVTKTLNYKSNSVILYAESLGCLLAIYLAYQIGKQDETPNTIILHSPFISLPSLLKYKFNKKHLNYLGYLFSLLYKKYSLDKYIKKLNPKINIIIAHSIYDNVIPYSESFKLFNLIKDRSNCQLINLVGSHYKIGMPDSFIYKLSEIFKQY